MNRTNAADVCGLTVTNSPTPPTISAGRVKDCAAASHSKNSIGTPPVYSIPGIGLTTGTKPAAVNESA
jgi:hypothetical protein